MYFRSMSKIRQSDSYHYACLLLTACAEVPIEPQYALVGRAAEAYVAAYTVVIVCVCM